MKNIDKLAALLIDDEVIACEHLENTIRQHCPHEVEIVGWAHNTEEAEDMIKKLKPHVIFIDIEMPGENAMKFLERISPFSFQVVFVTAYDEYAVKAFKLNAIDYILKPIATGEVKDAIDKVVQRVRAEKTLSETWSYQVSQNQIKKIRFRSGNGLDIVDISDLYYIEAQRAYSKVVFNDKGRQKELLMSQALTEYEELLPGNIFYRVHKSYLVNCMHVQKIITSPSAEIVLADKSVLPISRRRYSSLMNFLNDNDFLKA